MSVKSYALTLLTASLCCAVLLSAPPASADLHLHRHKRKSRVSRHVQSVEISAAAIAVAVALEKDADDFLALAGGTAAAGAAGAQLWTNSGPCTFEKETLPPPEQRNPAAGSAESPEELQKQYLQNVVRERTEEPALIDGVWWTYLGLARKGHWPSRVRVAEREANSRDKQDLIKTAGQLAEQGIGVGYYYLGRCKLHGEGVARNERQGLALLLKATRLGNPQAMHELGKYLMEREATAAGLSYHLCATRQGFAPSMRVLADYVWNKERNAPMHMRYLLRCAGLGDRNAASELAFAFSGDRQTGSRAAGAAAGYAPDPALSRSMDHYRILLVQNAFLRFPAIGKEISLPEHPEQKDGRHLPSLLKDLCGGKWPDDVFPELQEW